MANTVDGQDLRVVPPAQLRGLPFSRLMWRCPGPGLNPFSTQSSGRGSGQVLSQHKGRGETAWPRVTEES